MIYFIAFLLLNVIGASIAVKGFKHRDWSDVIAGFLIGGTGILVLTSYVMETV